MQGEGYIVSHARESSREAFYSAAFTSLIDDYFDWRLSGAHAPLLCRCARRGSFVPDEVGLVFPDVATARDQATRVLAEMARDLLPGTVRREVAIEVKDESRALLLRAGLSFEMRKLT